MNNTIWVRIRATGADVLGREILRAATEIKKLSTVTQAAGRDMRIGAQMMGQSLAAVAPRTAHVVNETIYQLHKLGPALAAQARVVRQSVTQMAMAMGLLSTSARTSTGGLTSFRMGISQMAMSTKLSAIAIRTNLASITASTRNMTSVSRDLILILSATVKTALGDAWRSARNKVVASVTSMTASVKASMLSMGRAVKTGTAALLSASTWKTLKDRMMELGETHKVAAHSIGIAFGIISASIGGGLLLATKAAMSFDRIMRNTQSISSDLSDQGLAQLSDQIIELSKDIPQSANALATGLYEIAQAGLQGQEGLIVLNAAAKAASAGLTDTVTASRGLLAVLNAYGKEVDEASYVSDVLFQTVKVGIISFEELSQQIGDFVGFAAAADIPIEDLGVAMAAMTRAGIPAAEAATSLNRVIQAFVKPSKAMSAEMERLHLTVDDLGEGGIGLIGVLDKVRQATGGQITTLQKLFPEIRAARGAYAIMAADGELLNEVLDEFGTKGDIAGQTARALAVQAKSAAYQFELTKNTFKALAIQIGEQILPAFIIFLQTMQDIGNFLGSIPGPIKTVAIAFGALATVFFGLAAGAFLIVPRLASVRTGLTALNLSARTTAVAMAGLKAAMISVSIVMAVATLALGYFLAKRATASQKEREYIDLLKQTGAALTEVSRAGVLQQLRDDGSLETLDQLGLSANLVADAMLGGKQAAKELGAEIKTELGDSSGLNQITGYAELLDDALKGDTDKAKKLAGELRNIAQAVAHGPQPGRYQAGPMPELDPLKDIDPDVAKKLADEIEDVAAKAELQKKVMHQLRLEHEATQAAMGASTQEMFGYEQGMGQLDEQTGKLTESQEQLNGILKDVSSPAAAYKEATDALKPLVDLTTVYRDALDKAQEQADKSGKKAYHNYTASLKAEKDAARDRARTAKDSVTDATAAAKSRGEISKQERAAIDANARASKRAADEAARQSTRATDARKKTADDFKREAQIGLNDYIDALQTAETEQDLQYQNMASLTKAGFGALAREIMKGGDDAAPLLAMVAKGTKPQIEKINNLYKSLAPSAKQSWNNYIAVLEDKAKAWTDLNGNIFKLVAKGRYDLVNAILSSDLDQSEQAELINSAVHQTKKGLDDMTALLEKANFRGSDGMAVFTDQNVSVLATIITKANQTGRKISIDWLYKEFKKNVDAVGLTKDDFVAFLKEMGTGIEELPKDTRVDVNTYVSGMDKLEKLKKDLEDVKALSDVPQKGKEALENALTKEQSRLEAEVSANLKVSTVSMSAGNVYINTSKAPNGAARAMGGIDTPKKYPVPYATGGIRVTSTSTSMSQKHTESYAFGGVRVPTVSLNVSSPTPHVESYADGGQRLPTSAIIQPAKKQLVQWAEPSTGGEAFIPLAKSKRSRSTAILNKVAEIFNLKVTKKSTSEDSSTSSSRAMHKNDTGSITTKKDKNYASYENGVVRTYSSKDLQSYDTGVLRLSTNKSLAHFEDGVLRTGTFKKFAHYENGAVRVNESVTNYENGVVRTNTEKNLTTREDGAINSNVVKNFTTREDGAIHLNSFKGLTTREDGAVQSNTVKNFVTREDGSIHSSSLKNLTSREDGAIHLISSKTFVTREDGMVHSNLTKNFVNREDGAVHTTSSQDFVNRESGAIHLTTIKNLATYENGVVRTTSNKNLVTREDGAVHSSSSKDMATHENGIVRITSSKNFVSYENGGVHSNNVSHTTDTSRKSHYENGVINTSVNKSLTSYDDGVIRRSVNDTLTSFANGVIRNNTSETNSVSNNSHTTRYENGVVSFENGGMLPRHAVVQHAKSQMIQWAEPRTGGEAFIPLAQGKRARSVKILHKVANMFGMELCGKKRLPTESSSSRVAARAPVGVAMGVASGNHRQPQADHQRCSEGHQRTDVRHFEQPVHIDTVMAHDYDDFRHQLDREARFRSMPGNRGGR